MSPSSDLMRFAGDRRFTTILADPPWQFQNRTGKVAPEHRRLSRYGTLSFDDIAALPVSGLTTETAHLYLWVPNALLVEGIGVLQAWGFQYKTNIVWHKVRKDGGSDGRGVGFYFRNVTELVLFGVRGKNARTLAPGRLEEAGRTLRPHRGVFARALLRAVRPRRAAKLGALGQSSRRGLPPDLENLRQPFPRGESRSCARQSECEAGHAVVTAASAGGAEVVAEALADALDEALGGRLVGADHAAQGPAAVHDVDERGVLDHVIRRGGIARSHGPHAEGARGGVDLLDAARQTDEARREAIA